MALALAPLKTVPTTVSPVSGSSDRLVQSTVPSGYPVRDFYLKSYASAPGPVISSSELVPPSMIEHLMRNKKDSALGVKFVQHAHSRHIARPPDAVTNMEGAMHTFVTPLAPVEMHGDYVYRGMHDVESFDDTVAGFQQARRVVLSALVQPDFEGSDVMLRLAALGPAPIKGRPLPDDFDILSVKDKHDRGKRDAYDELLRLHMIYHLVAEHALPSAPDVSPLEERAAFDLLQSIADGSRPPSAVQNTFVRVGRRGVSVLALEVLFMTAYHQMRNELSALEYLCAEQGYVYTSDPPRIFAQALGSADLLVRCQAAALRALVSVLPAPALPGMRAFAINNYADRDALGLFQHALEERAPHVAVVAKASLFRGGESECLYAPTQSVMRGALLVLHNNSDGFGQNIETEPCSSLDGAIGCASSAAASLHRQHPRLLDHCF